jgi:SanA protein
VSTLALGAANVIVLRAGAGASADPSAVPRADAALVLGAGVWSGGRSTPALRERLLAGAELMRAGRVPRLVLSGGPEEVAVMRTELLDLGLDPQTLVSDPAGMSTLASVHNAAARLGLRSVTVVTQRFHIARALWLARSRGLRAHGLVADGLVPYAPRDGGAREILARAKAVGSIALGA